MAVASDSSRAIARCPTAKHSRFEVFPLFTEAQEIIASRSGLRQLGRTQGEHGSGSAHQVSSRETQDTAVASAKPVLYVADVDASATFYRDQLGSRIDFVHGNPHVLRIGGARRRELAPEAS